MRERINAMLRTAAGILTLPFVCHAFTSCTPVQNVVVGGISIVVGGISPSACTSGHYFITKDGLSGLGLSSDAITQIARANIGVDTYEGDLDKGKLALSCGGKPQLYQVTTKPNTYSGEHHFDRAVYPDTTAAALKRGADYLQGLRADFVARVRLAQTCADMAKAISELGQALHVLQDLYSHSNFVDLPTVTQGMVELVVLSNPNAGVPPTFKLTAFDPTGMVSEMVSEEAPSPDFENYSHCAKAKDFPGKNDEADAANALYTSKYAAAKAAATNATRAFVAALRSDLGNDWNNVLRFGTRNFTCSPYTDHSVESITSGDPNDKTGLSGSGALRYLSTAQPLSYSIYFDNVPTASAPAQTVVVSDQLVSSVLDLSTVSIGPISFVDKSVTPPAIPLVNLGTFSTDVDLRPAKNLIVRINAALDQTTGVLAWNYTSLDPATKQLTTDPLAGFLPPGTEGSVSFSVLPKAFSTGTQITNKARIVFDVNAPIDTPVWLNTLDNTKPTSHIDPLAATQTTTTFTVSWTGSDVGAGVRDTSVYVSNSGGPFTAWQTNTTATSGTFTGTTGHTYAFYSIARDLVGNMETSKSAAEATTTISTALPPTIQCTGCYFLISGVRATLAFNVGVLGSGSTFTYNYRTSTQTVQFASTTTSQIAVNGNTATFSGQGKLNGQSGYYFTVTAKDGGGVASGLDTVSISITGPGNYSYSANASVAGGDIVVKQ